MVITIDGLSSLVKQSVPHFSVQGFCLPVEEVSAERNVTGYGRLWAKVNHPAVVFANPLSFAPFCLKDEKLVLVLNLDFQVRVGRCVIH
jgi:hypothetical protein